MLNLLIYAAEHRLRIRNLHDDGPVPPTTAARSPEAFPRPEDRDDAIVLPLGYVVAQGTELGWVLLCDDDGRRPYFAGALAAIRELPGVRVWQECDTEAAGTTSLGSAGRLVDLLRGAGSTPTGSAHKGRFLAPGSTQIGKMAPDRGQNE